jgi:uncharacterized protein (TIGR02217 family)
MTADSFSRPYLALSAHGGLVAVSGYSVGTSDGGITQEQAYAVVSHNGEAAAGVAVNQAYAVLSHPSSATSHRHYVVGRHEGAAHTSKGYVVLTTIYPPYEALNVEYPFAEEQFPPSISYGSSGGPGFKTTVFTVDSGAVHTKAEWDRLRATFDVNIDACPRADIEAVENFFYTMRGSAIGFRFKDWSDYQIVNQNVVVGNGASTRYQLFKRYRSGAQTFDRIIRKPVRNQIGTLTLDGVELVLNRDFFFNYSTGEITFKVAPPAGSIGHLDYAEFDIPVRFDTDELVVSAEDFNQYSISSLSLIEILA